jgi:hypothetical protein
VEIRKVKIELLNPAPYNPRKELKPGDPEYEQIKRSIEEFDLIEPLIWNQATGNLVGGHQRLNVLKEKGFSEVDVSVVNIPELNKEKALNIALNKIAGEWDDDKLGQLLNDIRVDFDLTDLGFSADELLKDFKIGGDGLTDPDEAPEVPITTNIKNTVRPILGDDLTTEECAKKIWKPAFRNLYEFSKDDCSFYMTMCQGGDQMMMMMMMMMMSEHWQIKHELIWVKSSPVFSMGRLDYDYQHEPILFGWKKKHNFYGGGQFLKSIWEIPKPSKSELHPTMKPVELMENALLNSSQSTQICLDLFGGSGSTLIACEKTGRQCRMMEIDPLYVQVIIDRWEAFSGKKAVKL